MTADANKAESMNCMDRAREAIKTGDYTKAKKMLHKAKNLDPAQDITFLLKKVDMMSGSTHETSSSNSNDTADDRSYAHDDHYEDTSNLRSRRPQKSPSRANASTANGSTPKETKPRSSSRTPKLGVDYTKEQIELVERIRHCKDYYEILRVQKSSSDAEIKKEYRKMALQLHPDKCRAPHATEAFKALGNAYAILSDAEKRRQYDLYGAEAPSHSHQPTRRHRGDFFEYDYAHGFDSDFTPEEIFNMFFGGGFPSESVRRRHARHAQREEFNANHNQNEHPYAPLLQLLPLIAILVLGLVAQFMVADPPFSLHQTQKYPVKRLTAEMKVAYYVRPDFEQAYRGRIKALENQVEDEYIQNLRMNCYKEQNQRETLLYRARWQRDEELIRRAERMAMPNCDRLREIYGR